MESSEYARRIEVESICSDFRINGSSPSLMPYLDKLHGLPDSKIFMAAIKAENTAAVSSLLIAKSDPNKLLPVCHYGVSPVRLATQCMDSDILQSILEFKGNPNERCEHEYGRHILLDMFFPQPREGYANAVKKFQLLLNAGADPNMASEFSLDCWVPSVFAMGMAMLNEDDEILALLLKKRPMVNVNYSSDKSILHEIVETGNFTKTKMLLSLDADVTMEIFSVAKLHNADHIMELLRLAKMMDALNVPRENLTMSIPSLQFQCLKVLARSTEFDVRLKLTVNDTPYEIVHHFYFPLEYNSIKESETEFAAAVDASLETMFEEDISFAMKM